MKILAISGSVRTASTNTAILKEIALQSPTQFDIKIFDGLGKLPIFSPDLEGENTPAEVLDLAQRIQNADALIFSSPEYVHAIPGGLKNAIDWLVSRDEIIGKPTVMVHGSHRGDDLLTSLRLVLNTVTEGFREDIFLRFHFVSKSVDEIADAMRTDLVRTEVASFLHDLEMYVNSDRDD